MHDDDIELHSPLCAYVKYLCGVCFCYHRTRTSLGFKERARTLVVLGFDW